MATRTVTGIIHDAEGQPWPDFDITFRVTPTAYTIDAHYPVDDVDVTTDENGAYSVDLEQGLEYEVRLAGAFVTVGSSTRYPPGTVFEVTIPEGGAAITLEEIRAIDALPSSPAMSLFEVEHNPDGTHDVDSFLPDQTGHAGYVLATDGTTADWAEPESGGDAVTLTGDQTVTGVKTFTGTQVAPAIGADIAPALSAWTLTGSAVYSAPNIVIGPTSGSLSFGLAVTSGRAYQIDVTATGQSGGTTRVQLGTVTLFAQDMVNDAFQRSVALVANTTGTVALTISGTTWSATITAVTVKEVTLASALLVAGDAQFRAHVQNVAYGRDAARYLTTGTENTSFGADAQESLTTGASNTAMGSRAQQNLRSGRWNTAVGQTAQRLLTTGHGNTAIGEASQSLLTTGEGNTSIGELAQGSLETGGHNTGIGRFVHMDLYTGSDNTAVGAEAGNEATTASRQTTIGYGSGQLDSTQVDDITTVGYQAKADATNGTAIGSQAQALHANAVALGSDAVTTAADQVMVGGRDIEITDPAKGVVMESPDGTRYRVTVENGGTLAVDPA